MSIICAFQFNVEVERGALRSLIGGLSNRFPGNRVSRDRPVLPLPLRRQNGSKLCFKGIPRVAAAASSQGLRGGEGRPLAEVYAVTINNIDNENPGDLYGTVKVTDHQLTQYIYNRERGNYKSISPGQNALLTGPAAQPILATNSFTIDVALMDKDSDASTDDHISDGQIKWNVNNSTNKYEEPISHQIDGAYGSATVVYAVLNNAVQASVEVTMIDGDGENPADVYGLIAASNHYKKTSHCRRALPSLMTIVPSAVRSLATGIAVAPQVVAPVSCRQPSASLSLATAVIGDGTRLLPTAGPSVLTL